MLNIINSLGLSNILVIVTRYFGGILLGTGGIVRAYSEATNVALAKAKIIQQEFEEKIKIIFEISKEKFENMLNNRKNMNFNFSNLIAIRTKYIDI